MFGKLNLVSPDLQNAQSVEALASIGKIKKVEDLIAREIDNGGKDVMRDPREKDRVSTGFLFCPRCGLRKPKDDGSKNCPNCGGKMIEEGSLPYIPKSTVDKTDAHNNILKEGNAMNRNDLISELTKQNKFYKNRNVLSNLSAIEKADSGEYKNAINEFTEAIHFNPNDAGSYFARATLRVRIGDIEGARQDFKMCEICHRKISPECYPLV
jgi:tetratricopeptide (TPR) repeat protein